MSVCATVSCFLSSSPDTTFLYLKNEFLNINCRLLYEVCPESKDTKVLNLYNIFNLKSDAVNKLPVHNFIFEDTCQHCPNIY